MHGWSVVCKDRIAEVFYKEKPWLWSEGLIER
jgi:hypothetical protein